jgi:hypothetical protein
MKVKTLILLLISLSNQTFAQLTKSVVDLDFPTLALPYSTQGQLNTNGLIERPINLTVDKFLKRDVSKELKFYDKKMFYFEKNSRCYSLGKIVNDGQIFILYMESVVVKNKNYGYNRSYLVPLKNDYQPVEFYLINEYTVYNRENNTLYNSKDTYWEFFIKDKLLYAIAKDARTKYKLADQVNPAIDLKEYKYVFDSDGKLKDVK